MNLNFILAMFVQKEMLTVEEAEHIAKEMPLKIHSSTFKDAKRTVDLIFKDFEDANKYVERELPLKRPTFKKAQAKVLSSK